jgi:hypothetical protein
MRPHNIPTDSSEKEKTNRQKAEENERKNAVPVGRSHARRAWRIAHIGPGHVAGLVALRRPGEVRVAARTALRDAFERVQTQTNAQKKRNQHPDK